MRNVIRILINKLQDPVYIDIVVQQNWFWTRPDLRAALLQIGRVTPDDVPGPNEIEATLPLAAGRTSTSLVVQKKWGPEHAI